MALKTRPKKTYQTLKFQNIVKNKLFVEVKLVIKRKC